MIVERYALNFYLSTVVCHCSELWISDSYHIDHEDIEKAAMFPSNGRKVCTRKTRNNLRGIVFIYPHVRVVVHVRNVRYETFLKWISFLMASYSIITGKSFYSNWKTNIYSFKIHKGWGDFVYDGKIWYTLCLLTSRNNGCILRMRMYILP